MNKLEKTREDLSLELSELQKKYECVKGELEQGLKEKAIENSFLEKLIYASEDFIHFSEETPDYKKIAQIILDISGAKYATLNIFDDNGLDFTTVALAGIHANVQKGMSLLGFDVIDKHWKHDFLRAEKIKDQTITGFNNLHELTGDTISKKVISIIEKTFNLGEAFIIKISKDNKVLGDFTLLFSKGETLTNHNLVDLYAHQVGMFIDRNKISNSFKISQEKYRQLVENTCEAICVLQNGIFQFANQMCCNLIGIPDQELIGLSMLEFLHKDDQELAFSQHMSILKGELDSGRKDFRIIDRKGDERWADVNSVRIVWDGKISTLNFATDITERKKAEDNLLKSEAKSKAILRTLPDMMFIQDIEGVFIDFFVPQNIQTCDPPRVFIGQRIENVLTEELTILFLAMFEKALKTTQMQFIEYSLMMPDKLRYYEARTINYETDHVLSIVRDITDRKMTEDTLINERFLLRTLIDNIPDSIYSKDLDCRKTLANRAEVKYMGANSESEVLGKDDFDIYEHETASKFFADDSYVIQTGKPLINREEFVFQKDQPKKCFLTSKLPLKDQNGNIIGIVGIGRDVTEQKMAEEALHRSEAKQAKMVANIGDVIVIIDKDGINRYKSPNIKKWFGWDPEEVISESTWKNVHPDDVEQAKAFMGCLMTDPGAKDSTQCRYKCKDGSYKWIEFTGINLLHDPDIQGLLGNYHDITERKIAEEKLLISEQRYRMLFERSIDAIFIVDTKTGKYLDANKAAEILTGKSLEELKSLITMDLAPHGAVKRLERIVNENNVIDMGEVEYLRSDGTIRTALINTIPLNKGEAYGIARDISDRKQAEAEIKNKNEELTRANGDKDKFISILAHDLKSPFSSILGFIGLLNSNIRVYEIEKTERIIGLMDKAAQNTFNLLEDLLLWIRSQSGKIPFDPQILNLKSLCMDIFEIHSQNAFSKRISLNYSGSSDIIVFADPDMLKTILRNLVSNAIKFTNTDGCIDVKAVKTIDSIKISVSDNGIGMDTEFANKLFNVAETHSRTGTANETGTGLGLIICKDFIEKHKGEIHVESKPGEGSNFIFSIPCNSSL